MKVLGSFSKGIKNSVCLNYCRAGGKFCDSKCNNHPENNGGCYGTTIQKRYQQYKDSLIIHEQLGPKRLTELAIKEVQSPNNKIDWFRFSVVGSLPQPKNSHPSFRQSLRKLILLLRRKQIPTHLPVESEQKYRFYTKILKRTKIVVRLSCQNISQWENFKGPVSIVCGQNGSSVKEKLQLVDKLKGLRNRPVMLCPAISGANPKYNTLLKCGKCLACSRRNVDVIFWKH